MLGPSIWKQRAANQRLEFQTHYIRNALNGCFFEPIAAHIKGLCSCHSTLEANYLYSGPTVPLSSKSAWFATKVSDGVVWTTCHKIQAEWPSFCNAGKGTAQHPFA